VPPKHGRLRLRGGGAVIFAIVACPPLLILSALQGVLLANAKILFLYDPSDSPMEQMLKPFMAVLA